MYLFYEGLERVFKLTVGRCQMIEIKFFIFYSNNYLFSKIKFLDRSFSNDCTLVGLKDDYGEGNSKVARMVARFQTFQKTAPKYQQPKINKDTLFYCCLVIEKVKDCAQIKFKFPSNVSTQCFFCF